MARGRRLGLAGVVLLALVVGPAAGVTAHPRTGIGRGTAAAPAVSSPAPAPVASEARSTRAVASWSASRAAAWPIPGECRRAAPSRPVAAAMGALLTLGIVAVGLRRRPTALLVGLAVLALAVETPLHSVHHLGDPAGARSCTVWTVGQHVTATSEAPPSALRMPEPELIASVASPDAGHPRPASAWLDRERAPPPSPVSNPA